jgi:hypothetical protein
MPHSKTVVPFERDDPLINGDLVGVDEPAGPVAGPLDTVIGEGVGITGIVDGVIVKIAEGENRGVAAGVGGMVGGPLTAVDVGSKVGPLV